MLNIFLCIKYDVKLLSWCLLRRQISVWVFNVMLDNYDNDEYDVIGRLQSEYKCILKVAFLYTDIPTKNNFSEKFMF